MKTVLVILLCVLVMLQLRLWVGAGSIAEIARLEGAIATQNEENANLEARNSVLMDEVSDLRNGLDSIEERARNELGLIRRGETFYLIVEDPPEASPVAPPVIEQPERLADPLPGTVVPQLPPENSEEENPYLEMFRDEEGAPPAAANEAQAATTPPAGQ